MLGKPWIARAARAPDSQALFRTGGRCVLKRVSLEVPQVEVMITVVDAFRDSVERRLRCMYKLFE